MLIFNVLLFFSGPHRHLLSPGSNVTFAAYQHPHPTANHIMLKVHCRGDGQDGQGPKEAVLDTIDKLIFQLGQLQESCEDIFGSSQTGYRQ